MARKLTRPTRVRLDEALDEAVKKHAEEIALAAGTGMEPDISAAIRDLLRMGLHKKGKVEMAGWASGYGDGVRRRLSDLVGCMRVCCTALEAGISPEAITQAVLELKKT